MANWITQGLYKFRFLIVSAAAMALLSAPFLTQADSQKASSAAIIDAPHSIAGLGTEVLAQGEAYEPMEALIYQPSGNQVVLESVSNGQGKTSFNLSSHHTQTAGEYTVQVRHLNKKEGYSQSSTFEVYPGQVSPSASSISLSKNAAESGEDVKVTVTLTDDYGNPIDNHKVELQSNRELNIYAAQSLTDQNGQSLFYVSGNQKSIAVFRAMDVSTGVQLESEPKLAIVSGSSYEPRGGFSINQSSVTLAAEGDIDEFRITGLDDPSIVGESQTVTVTAIDSNGFTVSDYTGTIRFSSTDNSATLPNDYTFTAQDQGEHTFSLAVKLLTPGTRTLTVTDLNQMSINGEVEVEVVTSANNGNDFNQNFETEDFEREGDFTLISPASGIYSTDSIEIQGEADYGYTAVIYLDEEEVGRSEVEFENSFSYTLQDVDDGTYDLYVDIVELGDGEPGEEEILEVIEASDIESVTIDTTAPEIVSISSDPEDNFEAGQSVVITVLSEADLEEATLLFEEELYEMNETNTSGKYQGTLVMPDEEGEYSLDVILIDSLGNEVQYRDELTFTVGEATTSTSDEDSENDDENQTSTGDDIEQISGLSTLAREGGMMLSWEAPESGNAIAYYRVYYGPSAQALYATSDTTDASTSWLIEGLTSEDIYYFAVAAIDIEGNEGPLSEAVSGVTLARVVPQETRPEPEVPAITQVELPPENPDTGPASTALMLLSILGAAGYMATRRTRAYAKSF